MQTQDSEEYINSINSDEWDNFIFDKHIIRNTLNSGNNILHMACIRGKESIVEKIINKYSELFYLSNLEGDNCAFLLLKYGWINILKKYILKYPDIITFINGGGNSLFQMSIDKPKFLRWLIDKLLDNQSYILDNINKEGKTILFQAIDIYKKEKTNTKLIEYLLSIVSLEKPSDNTVLMYSLTIEVPEIVKIVLRCNIKINVKNNKGITPLMLSIKNNYYDITKILIEKGANINVQDYELKNSPANITILSKNENIFRLLMDNIDFKLKNKNMNTPMHYLINTNKKIQWIDTELLYKIITEQDITQKNIKNITPYDILIKSKLFHKFDNIQKNTIKNIMNQNEMRDTKINMPRTIDTNYGQFNPDMLHNIFYTIIMLKKYNNLMIPYQHYIPDKVKFDRDNLSKLKLYKSDTGELFNNVLELFTEYFYEITPHIIIWHDKNLNYVNKNIELYLQKILKNKKIRFILFKLTIIVSTNSSHANVILYDKELNEMYRFEPYGKIDIYDYEVLNKRLEKLFKKSINEKMKFYSPMDFMDNIPIQIMSNDFEQDKKKLGDPQGYCLAFCFWFIEIKILNPDTNIKILMEQGFNIITEKKSKSNSILDYIRNYSYRLNKLCIKFLSKAGINKKSLFNISFDEAEIKKILLYSHNEFEKIIKLIEDDNKDGDEDNNNDRYEDNNKDE